ncbi:MAG: Bax inhibitor-1/YccA family protein [Fimbriimonadaceae bacterium]
MNQWFKNSNPAMKEEYFTQSGSLAGQQSGEMTLNGTIGKTSILLALTIGMAVVGYIVAQPAIGIGCFFVAFVLGIVGVFKRDWAMPISLAYAPIMGFALGTISLIYSLQFKGTTYAGLVPMAVVATFAVFGTMLSLYATRIIRVTETFRTIVIGATLAVFVFYVGSMVIGFFAPAFVNALPVFGSGVIGIGFSIFVIVLAAANLALDFDMIERGVQARAPKSMEWYGAFALLITLVWLYLEILRLLAKLASRR